MAYRRIFARVCFALFGALLYSLSAMPLTAAENPSSLHITRITPSGEDVPAGRQIVFQFDRPVAPIGVMERKASEIPIAITPALACQWRWLDSRALACQLDEESALTPATSYSIVVNPGIKALDGATLETPVQHTFITERPKVDYVAFQTWQGPGFPVLRITFNQPVFQDSVVRHIHLETPGDKQDTVRILATPDPEVKEAPLEDPSVHPGVEARRVWLVSPETALPLNTEVSLVATPGLTSFFGPEKGIEDRVLVSFATFPDFAFEGVECTDNKGKPVRIAPDDHSPLQDRCNPLRRAALVFSSPVMPREVKERITFIPDLAGNRKDYDPWANRTGYSRLHAPRKKGQVYRVWLPELPRAFQEYHVQSASGALLDEFGRTLSHDVDMLFATDHRLPDFVITHRQAVLEKGVDSRMPLVTTNLKKVQVFYDRLTVQGKKTGQSREIPIPRVEDVAFAVPLQVREMLSGASGVVQGDIQTLPRVSKTPWQHWFMAQVTPFQVHVKIGHYNSLAWVTDLSTGQPVEGVGVTLYRSTYGKLPQSPVSLTKSVTDARGVAMLAGTLDIDPELEALEAWDMKKEHLFVRVEKEDDMALLPLDSPFRVDTWQASGNALWSEMRQRYGHIHSWGTTAQGVYRAGDAIQYKLYVRNQDNDTFVPPPLEGYHLKVVDPMGKTVHEVKDLTLNRFGAFSGEFETPRTGAVGWYRFELSASFADWVQEPMRVLVSDFTPSPFKVATELNGAFFQPGDTVEATTRATLHAGGPYGDAHNRVAAILKSCPLILQGSGLENFQLDTWTPDTPPEETVFQTENRLDSQGIVKTTFSLLEENILYGRLMVESAVRDDRGKSVAGRAYADYAARDRFAGVRRLAWVMEEDKPARFDLLVVNGRGAPVSGVPIQVTLSRRETRAARVKGAGNAYITRYTHHWVPVDHAEIRSSTEPVSCSLTPKDPGLHRITAAIKDTKGRKHESRMEQWVVGKGDVVWDQSPDNRLEIIPEKKRYAVGDQARYLVKNPFPGAMALITVERYGILKQWVQPLSGSTPVISLEVERDFLPGFYLSVAVVSPRVEQPPLKTGAVDLGKPTFRMGYVKTDAFDVKKQMHIEAAPEQDTYKPGDRVRVRLLAKPVDESRSEPVEMAVAVLDESVFDLIAEGQDYFNPYKGFYTLDGLDLQNFSLLMGLVGRQKFEKKGANAGGGGGPDISLRSVFKFVSYWNPSIFPDKEGKAEIAFDAPDNLTGWRILVMAVTPGDCMGLGQGRFKVNRPTEIRPVMPNQVTAGDQFQAGFSVMNRTSEMRRLTVAVTAKGPVELPEGKETLEKKTEINLPPFKRSTVWLPVTTRKAGSIAFTAKAWDGTDADGVTHQLTVNKRYTLQTAADYGSTVETSIVQTLKFPEDMRTDTGGIALALSPTVLGNLRGAFEYLKDYPYACWEQILSKGVMAAQYDRLRSYLPADFQWSESASLPGETLKRASDFQTPNGGMAYFIPEDRYVSPYLSAYTALALTWLRSLGYEVPGPLEQKLQNYLLTLLRRDTLPDFYSKGMASTVRAVALAALAKQGRIDLSDLERYAPHVPEMSLFGKAHFLLAALCLPGTEEMRSRVVDMILSHGNESGGKMVFSEMVDPGFDRILASPLRTSGAVLSALTAYARTPAGGKRIGDIPVKLTRFITQSRKNRDHWENTQENLFCMKGLVDYAGQYEASEPDMTISAFFDQEKWGEARFTDVRDAPAVLKRAVQTQDPGRTAAIRMDREGRGRIYYATRLSYAPLQENTASINAGMEVRREYSILKNGKWTLLKSPMPLNRGDLVRVDIFVSLPAARNFVVVNDPVPGGLEPVNRDLATASTVDADRGVFEPADGSWWFTSGDWCAYGASRWSFYHQELRHDAARFYSEYLPAGNYHLAYAAQAVASGTFVVLPVHGEEMYEPDIYGQGKAARLVVAPPEKSEPGVR